MIKTHFQKELLLTRPQGWRRSNTIREVLKIQSWLNLHEMASPGTGLAVEMDGDFGPATEAAVKVFQKNSGLVATGVVDRETFDALSAPLRRAFSGLSPGGSLNQRTCHVAGLHLQNKPFELEVGGETNCGPWVRSFMDGNDGSIWLWCMGFVQTAIDQAASEMNVDFRDWMPHTYSCDTIGNFCLAKGALVRNEEWKLDPALANPGDVFLMRKSRYDWNHTGIIAGVEGQTIRTIEGNTNHGGSRNGNGVYARIRNYHQSAIDFISLEKLTKNQFN